MPPKYENIDMASALNASDMASSDWRKPKSYLENRLEIIEHYSKNSKFSKSNANKTIKKLYFETREELLKKQKEKASQYKFEIASQSSEKTEEWQPGSDSDPEIIESRPSFERKIIPKKEVEDINSFVGMHHILDNKSEGKFHSTDFSRKNEVWIQ